MGFGLGAAESVLRENQFATRWPSYGTYIILTTFCCSLLKTFGSQSKSWPITGNPLYTLNLLISFFSLRLVEHWRCCNFRSAILAHCQPCAKHLRQHGGEWHHSLKVDGGKGYEIALMYDDCCTQLFRYHIWRIAGITDCDVKVAW